MATPSKILNGWGDYSISGSPERFLDRSPDGTLWFFEFIIPGGNAHLWYSKDQGTTWSYGGDPVTPYAPLITTQWPRGFHIDAEGYAHYVMRSGNSTVNYYRGTPKPDGKSFTWKFISFDPTPDALNGDAGSDLVAFRTGSGWKAFLLYTTTRLVSGVLNHTQRLAQINIDAGGNLAFGTSTVVRAETGNSVPFGCLAFQHAGDGKTATATPHVYVVSGITAPKGATNGQSPLRLYKHTYSSGSWSLGAAVVLDAATDLQGRTLRCGYDGQRLMVAYGTRDKTVGTSSGAIEMAEWVEASGVVTARNPGAYGGGYPANASMSIDLSTGDCYVAAYGETVYGTTVFAKFARASATWGGWATAASFDPRAFGGSAGAAPEWGSNTVSTTVMPGKFNLAQYAASAAVEAVYLHTLPTWTGPSPVGPWVAYYIRLASINSAPSQPVLLAPAASSVVDLETNGYTFRWRFVDPDPGDIQSSWALRRKVGAGAYQYFNASAKTWGGSLVFNTGSTPSVAFDAGQWLNGTTYNWSVSTKDAAGVDSGFAADQTVVASVAPALTVDAPSGSYVSDSSPVCAWTFLGTSTQRTFRVKVFTQAVYSGGGFDPSTSTTVWDSGETSSSIQRTVRIGATLANGVAYRAYVQVSDSNAIYSDWAYSEFLLMLTAGPAPRVEAAVETDNTTGLPHVRLTVQGLSNMLTASQASGHSDVANQAANGVEPATTTYWQQASGGGTSTIARQATGGSGGNAYIRQTFTAASTSVTGGIQYSNTVPDPNLQTRPGEYVSASAMVRVSVAQRMALLVQYIDEAGNIKQSTQGTPVVVAANTWTAVSLTQTTPAPADTTRVRVYVYSVSGTSGVLWASGNTVDVDALNVTNPGRADWNNDTNCTYGKGTVGVSQGSGISIKMTAVGAGDMRLISGPGVQPLNTTGLAVTPQRDFPVEVGQTYTCLAAFTAISVVRLCRITLRWYDATDTLLSSTSGTGIADVIGFPTQMQTTGVAPVGADRVRVVLEVVAAGAGESHEVDGVDLHPGLSTTWTPGGFTITQAFTVTRTLPDGSASIVRGGNATSGDNHQRLILNDREMPFATDVLYSAVAASILVSGQPLASAASAQALANVEAEVWAIRDPLDYSTAGECRALVTDYSVSVTEQSTAYRPAGRALPVVETEGVNGEDGKISLTVLSYPERLAMKALVARPTPMIIQSPLGENTYVRLSQRDRKAGVFQSQDIDLTYVEVDAPQSALLETTTTLVAPVRNY